jgi:hypothetical protein
MSQVHPALPVPAMSPPSSGGVGTDIVPVAARSMAWEPVERKMADLRHDRVAHSRKQIWTKDAHGGPYQKVSMGQREGSAPCLRGSSQE